MLEHLKTRPRRPDATQSTRVDLVSIEDLDLRELSRWSSLADRAESPNPFYRPQFLLPLLRSTDHPWPQLLVISNETGQWTGMSVVTPKHYASKLPFPHLEIYQHDHIFHEVMLIDDSQSHQVRATLFDWLGESRYRHGFAVQEFAETEADSEIEAQLIENKHNVDRFVDQKWSRAACQLNGKSISEFLKTECSKSRRKSLNRARKRLSQRGEVRFQLIHGAAIDDSHLQKFLTLEQAGWKGDQGTAIASNPRETLFFRQMVEQLAAFGNVLFGELSVGDRVIASTCNFLDGDQLFAFKIGWHSEYKDGSPGMWSELELMEAVATELPYINLIDSCSQPNSHLDQIWPDRVHLQRVFYSQSRRSKLVYQTRQFVRQLRTSLQSEN